MTTTSDWQPIDTAPKDGTRIQVRARNMGGAWMHPFTAWWAENTAPDAFFTHFWADRLDAEGHPVNCYHPPLEWRPLEEVDDATS